MQLVGVTDNHVVQSYGSNWGIKSDKPIKGNKFYFEYVINSNVTYSYGNIGVSNYKSPSTYGAYLEQLGNHEAYGLTYLALDGSIITKGTQSINSNVGKRMGIGYIFNTTDTLVNLYEDDILVTTGTFPAFDSTPKYVQICNTWNHNQIDANFYFDNNVIYKDTAALYMPFSAVYVDNIGNAFAYK